MQSFLYENHCYLHVPIFFLLQELSFSAVKEKAVVIAVSLKKLDLRPQTTVSLYILQCIHYHYYI